MALARVASAEQQQPPIVVLPRDVVAVPSRRRAFTVVAFICAAVAVVSAILFAPRTSESSAAGAGFSVTSVRDAAQTLRFVPGEPAVIVFASSWSDSEAVLRQVDQLVGSQSSGATVQAMALMVKDSPTRALAAVDALSLDYQIGLDSGGLLAERYGVTRLPAVVTVDEQGLVVGRQQAVDDASQVTNLLKQLEQRTPRSTNGSN